MAVLIGYTLLRTTMAYFSVITYETCSQKLVYKLRKDLYRNMQEQDQDFYSRNRTGDLMTRLTGDMDMVRFMVAWIIRQLIDCTVLFLTTSICFLVTDWLFAPVAAGGDAGHFPADKAFCQAGAAPLCGPAERLSQLNTSAQENISGNRVVKAFARENYEIAKFDEKNEAYKTANTKASLLWLKFSPYIDGVSQSLAIAVLLVGGIFLIWGRISIGTFTLFNSLCWTLTNPMRMLGMHINDLQRFFASANKIIELYYSKSTITSRADAKKVEGRLRGGGVPECGLDASRCKGAEGYQPACSAGRDSGHYGSHRLGKSSLVSLIPRFSDVTKGEVCVDGVPVGMYPLHDLRASVGLATQEVFLFSDTVDGNIAYGGYLPL